MEKGRGRKGVGSTEDKRVKRINKPRKVTAVGCVCVACEALILAGIAARDSM